MEKTSYSEKFYFYNKGEYGINLEKILGMSLSFEATKDCYLSINRNTVDNECLCCNDRLSLFSAQEMNDGDNKTSLPLYKIEVVANVLAFDTL